MLLGLGLGSCQKEFVDLSNNPSLLNAMNGTNMNSFTTSVVTPNFDWENTTNIMLPDGTNRILPWFSSSITAIPSFILNDYKKSDGWELIYNLCNTPGQLGQNYFIIYNKFTGILRTFYFLADNVTSGSNGLWGITIDGNNSLLNNAGYFTIPMDDKTNNPFFITSNITNESISKTINRGWNAFDTEFTYDNSINQPTHFYITTFNKNIQDITLSGDLDLQSNGSIITSSSKNSWKDASKSAAKSAGSAASSYITEKIKPSNKIIKIAAGLVPGIISGGVTEIVGAGINLLFGSFIGKKTTTTQSVKKIEFKTNGTLELSGSITGTEATNVSPVANLLVPGTDLSLINNTIYPNYNKKLGVWNLKKAPKIMVSSMAGQVVETNNKYVRNLYIDPASIEVDLNPDLLTEIDNYTISTDLFYYEKFSNDNFWNGSTIVLGNNSINSPSYIPLMSPDHLVYDDGHTKLYKNNTASEYFYGPDFPAQTDPDVDYEDFMYVYTVLPKYVVKVTVTLYPKATYNTDPIVITRSFKPTYELY